MRESIGATWIFIIVITFVTVFSGYLAFSINYSKAFKVKDGIVTRIEKYNGPNNNALEEISSYLREVGYTSTGSCAVALELLGDDRQFIGINIGETPTSDAINNVDEQYNYCILQMHHTDESGQVLNGYYQVIVFYNLPLPIIDRIANFKTTGETTSLFYPDESGTFEN